MCRKFSDFENLQKAQKKNFFLFKTYFSIILQQKFSF